MLQSVRGGWTEPFERWLGDRSLKFLRAIERGEQPSLRGEVPFRPVLATVLDEFEVDAGVDEMYALWLDIVVDEASMALVRELRERGLGVHLATNQNPERRDHMRTVLGYDEHFDESFYSCEVGVAKPDPRYFTTILDRLGVAAEAVLFIDDNQANVDGARSVGLNAEQWQLEQGHDRLRALLDHHLGCGHAVGPSRSGSS